MGLKSVSAQNFKKEVGAHQGLVVAKFWAPWCGPCHRYSPVFERISKSHSSKAKFVTINIDDCQDLGRRFGIKSVPNTAFFWGGELIFTLRGLHTGAQLAKEIDRFAALG